MLPLMRDPQTKPEWGAELDPSHPLVAQGVSLLMPFNEGMGTIVKDVSGSGLTGTLNGGVTWAPTVEGVAPKFDGSTGRARAETGLGISGNVPLSMFARIIPTTLQSGIGTVAGLWSDNVATAGKAGYGLCVGGSGQISVQYGTAGWASGQILQAGKVQTIGFVKTPGASNLTTQLYYQGLPVSGSLQFGSATPTPVPTRTMIGGGFADSDTDLMFGGIVLAAWILPYAASAQQAFDLNANPWSMFAPRTLRMAGGSSGGFIIGGGVGNFPMAA